jgi:lipopolysaccharide export system ATP-binding protein
VTLLHADSIGKIYDGQRVLTAASLAVQSGEIVGLLGRMGVGKSTLLKICAGVMAPDSGWVRFAGVQYFRPRLHELAPRGMYFLAESRNLANNLSLRCHLDVLERRYGSRNRDEVVALLKLESLLNQPAYTLSGGERRRAEIAVAMTREPTCLLADEPFRGIDPIATELIGRALQHLAKSGCAVAITGHEIRSFLPFLSSVVWMTAGTTYALGSPSDAWKHDRFRLEYLGAGADFRESRSAGERERTNG